MTCEKDIESLQLGNFSKNDESLRMDLNGGIGPTRYLNPKELNIRV